MAIKIQGTNIIEKAGNSIDLVNINNANVSSITLNGETITASGAEINTLSGANNSTTIQQQLYDITETSFTLGTLNKTFTNGESANIALSKAVTAPIVEAVRNIDLAISEDYFVYASQPTANSETKTIIADTIPFFPAAYPTSTGGKFNPSEMTNIFGAVFKDDRTKLYLTNGSGSIYQYSLQADISVFGTYYITSSVTYDNVFYNTGISTSRGLRFKPDGTRFYVLRDASPWQIRQFNLSTPWDLSTASDPSQNGSLQGDNNNGFDFNADGTKLYVIASTGDQIYQYSLGTAWDVTTLSYDSVSFAVESGTPTDVTFVDNGRTMLTSDSSRNSVDRYNLSTAYDITTAGYSGDFFDINSFDTLIEGISVSPDGKYLLICGYGDVVWQFLLSDPQVLDSNETPNFIRHNTAYDADLSFENVGQLQGSSYDNVSFSVGTQINNAFNIRFGDNGSKMYVCYGGTNTNYALIQYDLTTPYDMSTASYSKLSPTINNDEPIDIAFNNNGTVLITLAENDGNHPMVRYTLSTAWDISTASKIVEDEFRVDGNDGDNAAISIDFNDDGTIMVMTANDFVYRYSLSTPFNTSTGSMSFLSAGTVNLLTTAGINDVQSIRFNFDGTSFYVANQSSRRIYQYDMTTPYNISTASYSGISYFLEQSAPVGFDIGGGKLFLLNNGGTVTVFQYSLGELAYLSLSNTSFSSIDIGKTIVANTDTLVLKSTDGAYEITNGFSNLNVTIASGNWEMYSSVFSANGALSMSKYIDVVGYGSFSNTNLLYTVAKPAQVGTGSGITFNTDGTRMFISESSDKRIYQYNLGTAYDPRTATYISELNVTSTVGGIPKDVKFSTDGTKMFVLRSNGGVYRFNLSTPFTLSTAVYNTSFTISSTQSGHALLFNNDGTKMFISEFDGDIDQFNLSTPWDITSIVGVANEFLITGSFTQAGGMAFNKEGTKLFITVGQNDGDNGEYSLVTVNLTTSFDLSGATTGTSSLIIRTNDAIIDEMGGLAFSNDGSKMIVQPIGGNVIRVFDTQVSATPYIPSEPSVNITNANTQIDVGSVLWSRINTFVPHEDVTDGNIYYAFSANNRDTWRILYYVYPATGTRSRSIVRNNGGTWQYNDGTISYVLADASFARSSAVLSQDALPLSVIFNNDGTKMYVLGTSTDTVYQYSLSTGFRVDTASYDSVSFQPTDITGTRNPQDIAFNDTGTKFYAVTSSGSTIYEYSVSTAFNLSTAVDSYPAAPEFDVNVAVSGVTVSPVSFTFNNDGSKLYVLAGNDSVYQFSLSTAFSITTASYDSISFSASLQISTPASIRFGDSGAKMFILNRGNETVYQYSLSTAYDISTASYDSINFSVTSQESIPYGLNFNDDGSKMYIVGSSSDRVHEYTGLGRSVSDENWINASVNDEFTALQEAIESGGYNLLDSTDLRESPRISESFSTFSSAKYDMAVILKSDGTSNSSVNFKAMNLAYAIQDQTLLTKVGDEYDYTFANTGDVVTVTSNADQTLRIKVL